MPLGTDTDITRVDDGTGSPVAPANKDEQAKTNDRLGNQSSLSAGSTTDDTTGTTLPAGTVPHGVELLVQAMDANTDKVLIGPGGSETVELKPSQSITLSVNDPSVVSIVAQTAGEGVNWLHEG